MSKSEWTKTQRSDLNYEMREIHRHLLQIEKIVGRVPLFEQLNAALNEAHQDVNFDRLEDS